MHPRTSYALLLPTVLLALQGTVAAQARSIERFVVSGAGMSRARGLDDQGRIVGGFQPDNGMLRAFLRESDGSVQLLGWPGAAGTWFSAINGAGVVLGYTWGGSHTGPFEYVAGNWSPFANPFGDHLSLTGLNDSGIVVANHVDAAADRHGAVFGPGGPTLVDYPGADFTELWDVNNSGLAVGSYRSAQTPWSGMLYDTSTGTFTAVDMPGAVDLRLYGINDAGEIVGQALITNVSGRKAVHFDGTQWRVLDLFGETDLSFASDIANDGTICGTLRGYRLGRLSFLSYVERRAGGGPVNYCDSAANSSGEPAGLHYQGSTSVAANDLVLEAGPGPANQPGIFFYGPSRTRQPFGDGFLCVAGPRFRLGSRPTNAEGYAVEPLDLGAPPSPAAQVNPGSRWYFQYWFRDDAAQGAGFNTSAALSIRFLP